MRYLFARRRNDWRIHLIDAGQAANYKPTELIEVPDQDGELTLEQACAHAKAYFVELDEETEYVNANYDQADRLLNGS